MMPKGFKSKNGYGTTKELGGATYHEVAKVMNEKGFKSFGHHNIFIS